MTIAELRALMAKATAGPWEERLEDESGHWEVRRVNGGGIAYDIGPNNAAVIAAAVNALPALLDVVEAAKETGHCCDHAANCCKEWCDSCQHFEKMNARFSTALAKLETP